MSEHSLIEVDRRATCAAEAEARLQERDPVAAEALLRGLSIEDPSGRLSALLGDACFLQGRYEQAAAAYLEALHNVPGTSDWEAAAKRAWENAALHRVGEAVGGALANVAGGALYALMEAFGRAGIAEEVWTHWYRDLEGVPGAVDEAIVIFKLAYMRRELFANNIVPTYLDDAAAGCLHASDRAAGSVCGRSAASTP
ncbi:MAG TPA: hypothetical protein VGB85_22480 [Nannocystis sp.]|jgi:tetratricopeptide (TPR) repeat protein